MSGAVGDTWLCTWFVAAEAVGRGVGVGRERVGVGVGLELLPELRAEVVALVVVEKAVSTVSPFLALTENE